MNEDRAHFNPPNDMIKTRIIKITMEIDTETHEGRMKMVITENRAKKKKFTVSEALSIATVLGHFQQELLTEMRQQSVREEFGLDHLDNDDHV